MEIVLTNMCMIHDIKNNKVLVLDKVKKEGWEGLTFPGGHVEKNESLVNSCKREIKEETNLKIDKLELKGIFEWCSISKKQRIIGFLYYSNIFSGNLIKNNVEGKLAWIDVDKFFEMKNKSNSMDDILEIYKGNYREIISYYDDDKMIDIDYIR